VVGDKKLFMVRDRVLRKQVIVSSRSIVVDETEIKRESSARGSLVVRNEKGFELRSITKKWGSTNDTVCGTSHQTRGAV
jgi:hypothetical protein